MDLDLPDKENWGQAVLGQQDSVSQGPEGGAGIPPAPPSSPRDSFSFLVVHPVLAPVENLLMASELTPDGFQVLGTNKPPCFSELAKLLYSDLLFLEQPQLS